MGVMPYFEFKGVKYGIGTILKVPITNCRWGEPLIKEIVFVGGGNFYFTQGGRPICLFDRFFNGTHPEYHKTYMQYIEIVKPIYYQEPEPLKPQNIFLRTGSGSWDAHNEVCVGLIWYIAIMLIGTIFNARLIIWIFATIGFFLWKSKK